MKFFARARVDFPGDEIENLRRRLAEAEERIKALEERAERARFLEAVVQGVAEPILVIDRDYNILLKNTAADGFWGTREKGVGYKCHEVSHDRERPCDSSDWPCPLRSVLETGKPVTVVHEHRSAHGLRTYEILASPLTGPFGEVEGIIETARDVTEGRRAEEELRKRERQQKAILDNIPDIAWLKDTEGRFIAVNEAFAKAGGFAPEELVGKTDYDVWPEDLADRYLADDREVIATGRRKSVEEPLVGPDERKKWIHTIKTPIYDDRGNIIGITGIARDITRRRLAEEDLRKFQFILENAGEEFYLIDFNGNFSVVNQAALKSLGYSREELLRMNLSDIDPNYDQIRIPKHFEDLKKGDLAPFETLHKTRDGRLVAKEVKSVYLEIGGKDYVCSFVRDISERKSLERQRNDFLAMVTHDLRSPLTAILGYSQLLKDEGGKLGDMNIQAMADAVSQSGERLLRLVEDFLTVSKMEAEKLQPRKAPTDLQEVLQKVERDFYLQAQKKGLALSLELPSLPLPKMPLDRRQMERVFGNLVQNAINYTPSGGRITVRLEGGVKAKGRGRFNRVSVSDTGQGIPKEEQEKVFSKYYRSPKTSGIKGSGLGLTIAKAVTEAHGGWVELESEPGKGSTFTVFLPI